ncbi:hypothetical protein FGO68_gene12143 [Halteria grandinella]|uniref:Uncharacterized protein n=1 Tax=Halteria grandinella TaxID=5974 RepID=A0A8J8NWL9_HALGN|nr:hypothetical protein FGO68_gene12143 [Halteria grandinella]
MPEMAIQSISGCKNRIQSPQMCGKKLCTGRVCKSKFYKAQLANQEDESIEESKFSSAEEKGMTPQQNMKLAKFLLPHSPFASGKYKAADFSFFAQRIVAMQEVEQSPCGKIHDVLPSTQNLSIEEENVSVDDSKLVLERELQQPHFSKRPQFVTSFKNGQLITSRHLIHLS